MSPGDPSYQLIYENSIMAEAATDAEQKTAQGPGKGKRESISGTPKRAIPKDFALRISNKVVTINERELDEEIASGKVASLVYKALKDPEMYSYFYDVTMNLLTAEEAEKYAGTMWTALIWHKEEFPEFGYFMDGIMAFALKGHYAGDRPVYETDFAGREFSAYAYLVGEVFIQMMRLNSDLYNILSDLFGELIRVEMAHNLESESAEGDKKKGISGRKKKKEDEAVTTKKLYDDVVDYISHRGEFRSDTLNQKNPNEYILILADRMRSTRRYIIQDIMNKHALEKKKVLEKELREREASAEDVISASAPFSDGLFLYWVEKRYNFKYLAVEKVRITLQILAITVGMTAAGAGFVGIRQLTMSEGIIIGLLMFGFAKLVCSRYWFAPYFPKDVSAELEAEISSFTPIFRKLSLTQINAFMAKQVQLQSNPMLLNLIPEYIKYITAVMPDPSDILLSPEELTEFMERVESNLSKQQRAH